MDKKPDFILKSFDSNIVIESKLRVFYSSAFDTDSLKNLRTDSGPLKYYYLHGKSGKTVSYETFFNGSSPITYADFEKFQKQMLQYPVEKIVSQPSLLLSKSKVEKVFDGVNHWSGFAVQMALQPKMAQSFLGDLEEVQEKYILPKYGKLLTVLWRLKQVLFLVLRSAGGRLLKALGVSWLLTKIF